jgi:hypothetical protein
VRGGHGPIEVAVADDRMTGRTWWQSGYGLGWEYRMLRAR